MGLQVELESGEIVEASKEIAYRYGEEQFWREFNRREYLEPALQLVEDKACSPVHAGMALMAFMAEEIQRLKSLETFMRSRRIARFMP